MPVLQYQDACSGAAPVASIGRSPIVPPARPSAARGVRHQICVHAGAAIPRRVLGCCPRRVDRPISDRAACPPERRSWRPTSNLRSCWAATPRRPRVLPRRVDRPISDRAACPTERRSWRPTTNSRSCRSRQAKASSSASNPPIQGLLPAASPLSCSPSAQSSTFSAPFLLLLQFNVYVASPAFARTRPTPHPNTTRRTTCRCAAQRPLAAFQLGPSDTTVAHAPPPRLLF